MRRLALALAAAALLAGVASANSLFVTVSPQSGTSVKGIDVPGGSTIAANTVLSAATTVDATIINKGTIYVAQGATASTLGGLLQFQVPAAGLAYPTYLSTAVGGNAAGNTGTATVSCTASWVANSGTPTNLAFPSGSGAAVTSTTITGTASTAITEMFTLVGANSGAIPSNADPGLYKFVCTPSQNTLSDGGAYNLDTATFNFHVAVIPSSSAIGGIQVVAAASALSLGRTLYNTAATPAAVTDDTKLAVTASRNETDATTVYIPTGETAANLGKYFKIKMVKADGTTLTAPTGGSGSFACIHVAASDFTTIPVTATAINSTTATAPVITLIGSDTGGAAKATAETDEFTCTLTVASGALSDGTNVIIGTQTVYFKVAVLTTATLDIKATTSALKASDGSAFAAATSVAETPPTEATTVLLTTGSTASSSLNAHVHVGSTAAAPTASVALNCTGLTYPQGSTPQSMASTQTVTFTTDGGTEALTLNGALTSTNVGSVPEVVQYTCKPAAAMVVGSTLGFLLPTASVTFLVRVVAPASVHIYAQTAAFRASDAKNFSAETEITGSPTAATTLLVQPSDSASSSLLKVKFLGGDGSVATLPNSKASTVTCTVSSGATFFTTLTALTATGDGTVTSFALTFKAGATTIGGETATYTCTTSSSTSGVYFTSNGVVTSYLADNVTATFKAAVPAAFSLKSSSGGTVTTPVAWVAGQGATAYTLVTPAVDIPNQAGTIKCTEASPSTGFLLIGTTAAAVTGSTPTTTASLSLTSTTTETAATTVGSIYINSNVPASRSGVSLSCVGDGVVFTNSAQTTAFNFTYADLPDATLNFMVDVSVLETLINAAASSTLATTDGQIVEATCSAFTDVAFATSAGAVFTVDGSASQSSFTLKFTSSGAVSTAAQSQFVDINAVKEVSFNAAGTYYLKCIQTGSTATALNATQYFVKKAVVTGAVDGMQLKSTDTTPLVLSNQATFSDATAVTVPLGMAKTFKLYPSVAFTGDGSGVAGLSCKAYTDAALSTAATGTILTATVSNAASNTTDTTSFAFTVSTSTTSYKTTDAIGTATVKLTFTSPGTYYLKCLYTGTTDANLLSIKATQWFQTEVIVKGAYDVFQLKTADSPALVLSEQDDLSKATAVGFLVGKPNVFNLYTNAAFTSDGVASDAVGLACTLYSDSGLTSAASAMTATLANQTSGTGLTTAGSVFSFTYAPGSTATSLKVGDKIRNVQATVTFTTAGTYYMKCLYTGTTDTGALGVTAATQWFQTKITVTGAVNVFSLKNDSVTLANQADLTSATPAQFYVGMAQTLKLYSVTGYTPQSASSPVGIACTAYAKSDLTSAASVMTTTTANSSSHTDASTGSAFSFTEVTGATTAVAASGQIGDVTVALTFTTAGTYYLQCLHTGTTDTGLVSATTTATQWFQTAVTVTGAVDVLRLSNSSVTLSNQASSTSPVSFRLGESQTLKFYTTVTFTGDGSSHVAGVSCTACAETGLSTAATGNILNATFANASSGTVSGGTSFAFTEATGSAAISAGGQIGDATVTLTFNMAGTYYLKCLHTGTTDTNLLAKTSTTEWFQTAVTVVGNVDAFQLKTTDASPLVISNQSDLTTATATTFTLDKAYNVLIYASQAFTGNSGNVGVACTAYMDAALTLLVYNSGFFSLGAKQSGVDAQTPAGSTAAAFAFDVAAGTTAYTAGAVVKDTSSYATVTFKQAGTYYLKCTYAGTTDTNALKLATAIQWFQTKITVTGAVNVFSLKNDSVTLANQADLTSATPAQFYVGMAQTLKLYSVTGYTPQSASSPVGIACTAYAKSDLTSAASVMTTTTANSSSHTDASTGSAFSFTEVTGATTAVAASGQIGDVTVALTFTTAGTYYLQCLHTGTTDTGLVSATTTASQWFQTAVTVTGNVDVFQLKSTDSTSLVLAKGQTMTASLGVTSTYKLYSVPGYTLQSTTSVVGLTCQLYTNSGLSTAASNGTMLTTISSGSSATNAAAGNDSFVLTEAAGATTAIAANGQIGDVTVALTFTAAGTYYMQCLHTGTADTGLVPAITTATQWFTTGAITVSGAEDVFQLVDSKDSVTLKQQNDLTGAATASVVINKSYSFTFNSTKGYTPASTPGPAGLTCTLYYSYDLVNAAKVGGAMTTTTSNATSSTEATSGSTSYSFAFTVTPATSTAISANGTISGSSAFGIAIKFTQAGTYYMQCVHTGTMDAGLVGASPPTTALPGLTSATAYFNTKIQVVGAPSPAPLSIQASTFSAVAGSGGSGDMAAFALSSGNALSAGTLLSSPIADSTTVIVLVGKTYSDGNLVKLRPASAPTADVTVDCLSSVPEVLSDITGVTLPKGSTADVALKIAGVLTTAYVQPTYVQFNCSPIATAGGFTAGTTMSFQLYVTPKFRITAGSSAPNSVSGATLNTGLDVTLLDSTSTDSCKVMTLYEGAAIGSSGANVVTLTSVINPGTTNTVEITCQDTAATASYRIYPSATPANTYVATLNAKTFSDIKIDQTASGNATTAVLIAPYGSDVTTTFKCAVTNLDKDGNKTDSSLFLLSDAVYFKLTVKKVTLSATLSSSSIVEGSTTTVTVARSDGDTSATFNCSTSTSNILASSLTAANFGSALSLTPNTSLDIPSSSTGQAVTIVCQPTVTTNTSVVYGDSNNSSDSVSVTLTILPMKLVAYATGGGGLIKALDEKTAIAPASGTDVDISGGATTNLVGFVAEQSLNTASSTLVKIGLNSSAGVAGTTNISCTADFKYFLASKSTISSFAGTATALPLQTSTGTDSTYADVMSLSTVTFTCQAVDSSGKAAAFGKMAAGDNVTFKIQVAPIQAQLILGTSGKIVSDSTKSAGYVLTSSDVVAVTEGQSLANVLRIDTNYAPASSSSVNWTCKGSPDKILGDSTSTTNSIPALTGVGTSPQTIAFPDAVFQAYPIGPGTQSVTLTCTYTYTGTGTAPGGNVGGIAIGATVSTSFLVTPKFPQAVAGSLAQIYTPASTTSATLAEGTGTTPTSLPVYDSAALATYIAAQQKLISSNSRASATTDQLTAEFNTMAQGKVPVVYAGQAGNSTSVKLYAPANLGAAGSMTCKSSDTTVIGNATVSSVAFAAGLYTNVSFPAVAKVATPTLITYTCSYDADVVTGSGSSAQTHITKSESLSFTLLVAPPALIAGNGSGAVGLTPTTQYYDANIATSHTQTPVLVAGSAASAAGTVITLNLNVALTANTVTADCTSSNASVLKDITGISVSGTAAVTTIAVPAPAAVTTDTTVTYTCAASSTSTVPATSTTKAVMVAAYSIRAVGGKTSANVPAYSNGLPAESLDNEYIDPMYSPVAGLVDLRPVVVEGQATAAGAIASILLPIASTSAVTVTCTSSVPSTLASFDATQTAAGHSIPLTIPASSPIDKAMDIKYTCAVKAAAGGYAAGISTSFTVNLVPLAITVVDSKNNDLMASPISVTEGVANSTSIFIGLNGVPGASTSIQCSAPNSKVFAASGAAYSQVFTFSTSSNATAFKLPGSSDVVADTSVVFTCDVYVAAPTPSPTIAATPKATTAPGATPAAQTPTPAPTAASTPAATTAATPAAPTPSPSPTPAPASIKQGEKVYFTVTVKAGVLTATAGKNAVDATGASITDKTLSSTVVPVLEVRKADYTGIVTVAAPYVASDYTVSCTSSTLSIMRTPSTSSYSITSTSQTFDLTIPAALSTGDVTISCAATDSNAAKGLISGTTLSIKLTVVGPGIQVLTGNATMANASDYGRIASGTDIAGTGDLTKTMVVPIGYAVPSGAISLRLKAPVSNPSVVITCASDTTSVMPTFTVTMSSTDSGALGNRNAIMTGSNALLTAAGTGTKDTLVTYTCASTCDNVSATIGTASFQVWVPAAGAYFLRATSSTYTARTSFIAATPTYTIYKKVDTVTILSGVSQQTQIYVYTSTAVALNMTCTSDQSTVSVSNTSTANSVSLTSNAFYTGAAATLTVKSSATANVTATITCTPQIGSGSYTTSTSFSFKVAAQPVQTLTAVAGTRNAKFVKTAPTAVTSVSIEALGVPIPGLVAIMSSDSSLTQTNAIGCTSSDATIIGDIITNSNQKATTNDATPVSPSGDFQNAVATVTSYSTETPSDYTNGFDTTKAYKYDLQLPVPKVI